MELKVLGRNLNVSERFHDYAEEKRAKAEALCPKAQSLEVKVSAQEHAQKADSAITVELTVKGKGPTVRAEACAADKFAAFDVAYTKLMERLRRARDKKKIHQGHHAPGARALSTQSLPLGLDLENASSSTVPHSETDGPSASSLGSAAETEDGGEDEFSPVLIRRKQFQGVPMSVDQAVDNMELVGHDFYLFLDERTGTPAVVYRRKGWSYGVISLDENLPEPEHTGTAEAYHARAAQREKVAV